VAKATVIFNVYRVLLGFMKKLGIYIILKTEHIVGFWDGG
jgi:hypothetical protein